jgi:DNA invertase Pin-like site-specific DNA recombinase
MCHHHSAAGMIENLRFTGEDSPMANLLLTLLGAVAEFERSLIRERQREGIAIAKKAGIYKGRKPSLTTEQAAGLRHRAKTEKKIRPGPLVRNRQGAGVSVLSCRQVNRTTHILCAKKG